MRSKTSIRSAAILLASILTVVLPTPAHAAKTCTFDQPTATATIRVPGGFTSTLSRSGEAILVDGVACGAATVTSTDLILFESAPLQPGIPNITIDLSDGPFAPGLTPEAEGNSEIEIRQEFSGPGGGTLKLIGSPDDDRIDLMAGLSEGEFGIWLDLNMGGSRDGEGDICAGRFERYEFDLGEGDDRVGLDDMDGYSLPSVFNGGPGDDVLPDGSSMDGFDGGPGEDTLIGYWNLDIDLRMPTFEGGGEDQALAGIENVHALADRNVIVGTDGPNELIGGPTGDFIFGEGEDDVLIGGGGGDAIEGATGDDSIKGGPGQDALLGTEGSDELVGGTGPDTLFGGVGKDHLSGGPQNDELRGGPGTDTCVGGSGVDLFSACEV